MSGLWTQPSVGKGKSKVDDTMPETFQYIIKVHHLAQTQSRYIDEKNRIDKQF